MKMHASRYMYKFAGHEINANKDMSDIFTKTLNDNTPEIYTTKTQKKTRYPHNKTYINTHVKIGNIIGSIHRIRTQCTYRTDFQQAIRDLIQELTCIGYTNTTIKKCLYRLAKQPEWRTMLDGNLADLNRGEKTIHIRTAGQKTRTTPTKPPRPKEQQGG